jgi:indolepyruvate ferredoxin oxidoreductase
MIENLLAGLNADNVANAVELANLPEQVRGFGHVKEAAVGKFRAEKAQLLAMNKQQRAA